MTTPAPEAPLVRLVDDDPDLLAAQVQSLRIAGFRAEAFASAPEALAGLTAAFAGVILSDVRMPGMDGFALFERVRAIDPDLPVILLTGHGDVPMAVAALKAGAYDFLTKPVGGPELAAALRRATAARALVLENRDLRRRQAPAPGPQLLGDSAVMVHLRDTVARVAEAGVDALIVGPSGAGKETVARAIHAQSPRRARPFVHLACATLDEARFDADHLGVDPGPGRPLRSIGRIEKAHRGTLFLDGIEALSPALQSRLLTVIETREVWPLGASVPRPVDLRLLASTRADLGALVAEGRFRSDLYYRLSGVVLTLPPLMQRQGDIPLLFRHFLLAACARLNLPVPPLTPLAQARLASHGWPGNLRELQQFAESHALGLSPFAREAPDAPAPGLSDLMATHEAELIREALRHTKGHAGHAMQRLRLARKTFYDKLTRYGIRPGEYRS